MNDQIDLLIDILLDKQTREDERGDAAIYLRKFKDPRALHALIKVASDPLEDNIIVANCAESIGEILVAINDFNEKEFRGMLPFAQQIVFSFVQAHNPALIKDSIKKNHEGF